MMKRNLTLLVYRFKRNTVFVWTVLLVFSMGMLFSACSKDEENVQVVPPPVQPDDPDSGNGQIQNEVVFYFEYSPGKDLRDLADITITLTDPAGNVTTEKVTSFPWKATVKGQKPCTAGYALTILPKDPLILDKAVYSLSFVYTNGYTVGGAHDSSFSSDVTVPVSKDKVPEVLEQMKDLYQYSYKVGE